jgi:hypothetical protein
VLQYRKISGDKYTYFVVSDFKKVPGVFEQVKDSQYRRIGADTNY